MRKNARGGHKHIDCGLTLQHAKNRPGASGNVALEAVASAPPDGYTLALLGVNNAIKIG